MSPLTLRWDGRDTCNTTYQYKSGTAQGLGNQTRPGTLGVGGDRPSHTRVDLRLLLRVARGFLPSGPQTRWPATCARSGRPRYAFSEGTALPLSRGQAATGQKVSPLREGLALKDGARPR